MTTLFQWRDRCFPWEMVACLDMRLVSPSWNRSGKSGHLSFSKVFHSSPTLPLQLKARGGRLENCTKVRAVLETVHHSHSPTEETSVGDLFVVLEAARTDEKLKAAAALRARSFYTYPQGRSHDAVMAHQRMKAEAEWETLTRKIAGLEPGYKRTTCVIVLCPFSDAVDSEGDLRTQCKISNKPEHVVVGTLDIYVGLVLPGELVGDHPQGPDAEHRRAYLSNICVAQEFRQKGIGLLLMKYVKKITKQWGVSDLYVLVAVDNDPARRLYERSGFIYEKEESIGLARSMCRPPRFLLRAQL